MDRCSYEISGNDFTSAGSGSDRLKEVLKRLGVAPEVMRRAMIAAYEAEMNVVIHARRGAFRATVTSDRIDVDVVDEGPGIPDIERAMQEGYSTASPAARELGFGAGMGLPNIRRNTDRFTIGSTVGHGTQLHFTVFLTPEEAGGSARNSIAINASRCIGCLRCLRACPVGALRVRGNVPVVLSHLCVDCPVCIRSCPTGALRIDTQEQVAQPVPVAQSSLLDPSSVRSVLRHAVVEYARARRGPWPVIAPLCPVVIALIRTRFHALLDHVPPFLTPVEAARQACADQPAECLIHCPSECTALRELNISMPTDILSSGPPPSADMTRVMRTLDEVENRLLADVPVLELYACSNPPCAGSDKTAQGVAARRESPLRPRSGIRLDPDMAEAIGKLARIDDLARRLPGRNCSCCGAPTCLAAAEDVVLGRISGIECPFMEKQHDPA